MARPVSQPRLLKADTGHWYIHYHDGQRTRRKSTNTSDERTARDRFAAWLTAADATAQNANVYTVAQALSDYRREHVVVNADTRDRAVEKLTAHFGHLAVTAVGMSHVRSYLERRGAGRIGRPSKPATVRRELAGVLSPALRHAAKWGRVKASDLPLLDLPPPSPPKDRWLTQGEMVRLIDAAGSHPRTLAFILLAYYTGSRRAALEKLTWGQVDLENRVIHLNPPGRAQTRKRRPPVPIVRELVPVLRRLRASSTGLFVLGDGGTVQTGFRSAVRRAGLEPPAKLSQEERRRLSVTPHTLRHTRAVHLAQDGVDLYVIAGLLGDTLATVERNYLHHSPDHLRRALDAAPRLKEALS